MRAIRGRRRAGRAFVLSSPSGGGKTTVINALVRRLRGVTRSVSVTTRAARPGERQGRDYVFLSAAAFLRLRRHRALLEWAQVHGAAYGTPRGPVADALADGRDVLLSLDVQGARAVRRALGGKAVLIFLLPPSLERLRERLRHRRTDSAAAIRRRLVAARREMACAAWYDHVVVNERLADTVARVLAIIRAERKRATKGR